MLFSEPIDSLAAVGVNLSNIWVDNITMPIVDNLGSDFLEFLKNKILITIKTDGIVEVEYYYIYLYVVLLVISSF